MKTIKPKNFLWTITIFLLWNCLLQAQTMKLDISLSKETYLKAEPIWLDAFLTNVSSDTVRIWGLCLACQYNFIIELRNEEAKVLPYTGEELDFILGPGFIIGPQETYYECYDLVQSFSQEQSLSKFFLTALDSGKYSVKAKYYQGRGKVIESNEISFKVESPLGEEAKSYQLLKDAHAKFCAGRDALKKQSLDQLLTQFPQSVYAEKACQLLFKRKDLLEKFPDSGFTQTSLDVLTDRMTKEKKQEFLQRVIKTHTGTRSAKFAEQMLRLGY